MRQNYPDERKCIADRDRPPVEIETKLRQRGLTKLPCFLEHKPWTDEAWSGGWSPGWQEGRHDNKRRLATLATRSTCIDIRAPRFFFLLSYFSIRSESDSNSNYLRLLHPFQKDSIMFFYVSKKDFIVFLYVSFVLHIFFLLPFNCLYLF